VLAKFDPRPFPPVPDLPVITQEEVPGVDEVTVWLGLVAPRGTLAAIVDKLLSDVAAALSDPAIVATGRGGCLPDHQYASRVCRVHPPRG
jgi:hypothetical protein